MQDPQTAFPRGPERPFATAYAANSDASSAGSANHQTASAATETILLSAADGSRHVMDLASVDQVVLWACEGIDNVSPGRLVARARDALHSGMQPVAVGRAVVQAISPLVGTGPGYSRICARLLLDSLWGEASAALGRQTAHGGNFRDGEYPGMFRASLTTGVKRGLVPAELLSFDLDRLANALQPERDSLFSYPTLRALYEHQLLQSGGMRLELPQVYFMRVAMGEALTAKHRNARAIEIYQQCSGCGSRCENV